MGKCCLLHGFYSLFTCKFVGHCGPPPLHNGVLPRIQWQKCFGKLSCSETWQHGFGELVMFWILGILSWIIVIVLTITLGFSPIDNCMFHVYLCYLCWVWSPWSRPSLDWGNYSKIAYLSGWWIVVQRLYPLYIPSISPYPHIPIIIMWNGWNDGNGGFKGCHSSWIVRSGYNLYRNGG